MTALIITAFMLFAAWSVGISFHTGRIPQSFTKTATILAWPARALWLAATVLPSILAVPAMIESVGEAWQFLAFLTAAFGVVVGIASLLADNGGVDKTLRQVSAWGFIASSQLTVAMSHWWLLMTWLPVVAILVWRKPAEWQMCGAVCAVTVLFVSCIL